MIGRLFKSRKDEHLEEPEEEVVEALPPRREERDSAYTEAVLLTRSGLEKRGILMDLSEHGARMRFVSADGLMPGDLVKVRAIVKSYKGIGVIRWKDKTDVGIEFHKRG